MLLWVRQQYLGGVALVSAVVAVDEAVFDLADDLADQVETHPHPDALEGVGDLAAGLELLELAALLSLVAVGEDEEECAEEDHDCVDCNFCDFCVCEGRVHLQWCCPRLTI